MKDKIKELCVKYRSIIVYIIMGCLTTAVDWVVYWICYYGFKIPNVPSNIAAWILAVIFSFAGNKVWVFESRSWNKDIWLPEFFKFVSGRLGTGAFEVGAMWLLVDILKVNGFIGKILVSVIVMVLNYVISRLLVFKDKTGSAGQ